MSRREQLNLYILRIQQRLRLGASMRGAALVACVALIATIVLAVILNAYAFREGAVAPARLTLFFTIVASACLGVAWPLFRLDRKRSINLAESSFPQFQQRLLTFSERDQAGSLS